MFLEGLRLHEDTQPSTRVANLVMDLWPSIWKWIIYFADNVIDVEPIFPGGVQLDYRIDVILSMAGRVQRHATVARRSIDMLYSDSYVERLVQWWTRTINRRDYQDYGRFTIYLSFVLDSSLPDRDVHQDLFCKTMHKTSDAIGVFHLALDMVIEEKRLNYAYLFITLHALLIFSSGDAEILRELDKRKHLSRICAVLQRVSLFGPSDDDYDELPCIKRCISYIHATSIYQRTIVVTPCPEFKWMAAALQGRFLVSLHRIISHYRRLPTKRRQSWETSSNSVAPGTFAKEIEEILRFIGSGICQGSYVIYVLLRQSIAAIDVAESQNPSNNKVGLSGPTAGTDMHDILDSWDSFLAYARYMVNLRKKWHSDPVSRCIGPSVSVPQLP
jgi:hypothetical protein